MSKRILRRFSFLLILSLLVSSSALADETINSDSKKMVLIKTIFGEIQPKSVLASTNGLVSAQNMMYKHSVTFYDSNTFELKATVSDQVNLTELGFTGYTGTYQGAPVEGAYSPDGKYLYVTNYAMYGKGFNHEGHDVCSPSSDTMQAFCIE